MRCKGRTGKPSVCPKCNGWLISKLGKVNNCVKCGKTGIFPGCPRCK